ncbi:ATP-binding protein [Lentzea sp. NPDC051213]|uniref:ATP-binding protein n=1 Tax=Lentzea sp. NPDC051213 TaxID=3364126 RepID=UPI0037A7AB21
MKSLVRSSRLVTLAGPGGVGKTRLALDFAGAHRGRVLLAELESMTELDMPSLVAMIGDGPALLVLDNCEHIVDSCAHLVQSLLRRCPELHVLATSREPLRMPAEHVLRIGGLPEDDSARLFADRARAADPEFQPDHDLVREICAQVDGLPLAIELAARRAGMLPLTHILSGVDDLLSAGHRTAPPRHRELRATIEWSHRLLTVPEQVVFRRISVFPGGFDIAAAERLCPELTGVGEIVCELAAKSLIERVPGEGRFRQLRVIRVFARELLVAAGEAAVTADRAVDRLAELVTALRNRTFDSAAVQRLWSERENLVAALEHARGHPLLTIGLARLWFRAGRLTACRTLLAAVLDRAEGGYAHALAARAACMQADGDEGIRLAEQAVLAERARNDRAGLADAVEARAFVLLCQGEFPSAIAAYRECLALVDDDLDVLRFRHNLAWALLCAGEIDEAERELARCLTPLRETGPCGLRTAALHTHGALRLMKGEIDAAEEAFVEVLRETPRDRHEAAYPVEALAIVAARRGDHARALRLSSAAGEMRRRTGVVAETDWQRRIDDALGRSAGAVSKAKAEELSESGRRLPWDRLVVYAAKCTRTEHPLTPRELEITTMVAEGLTNKQIAGRLRLSARTVAFHLNHVRDKLGVRTRTQIALWLASFVTAPTGDHATDVRAGRDLQHGHRN